MLRVLAAVAAVLAAFAPARQELKSDVLEKLRDATVYVVAGDGTGSGFLFLKRGSVAYLMTCEHVVGSAQQVNVVFWSGTAKEKTHAARVIATDPSRDIACLVLRDVKDLPAPLELGRKTEVKETETVFAAGFPFGSMLATGKKNPEISISKSSVTSIRRGENRETIAVQISGEVNPGNSGGPLVTADGRVVGVTAAKIAGTQTAFAVPSEEIQGFLKGRVKRSTFRKVGGTAKSGKYEIRLSLVDPLATLKGVGVAWINENKVKDAPAPEKDGTWKKIHASMTSVEFDIDEDHAVETVEFEQEGKEVDLCVLFQCYFVQSDGKTVWTQPATHQVEFGPGTEPAGEADPGRGSPPGASKDGPDPEPLPPGDPSAISLMLPEDPKFAAELKIPSMWGALILAPDGSALYALDLSEGLLCKLDPETLKITAKIEVHEWSVALALSPDGKTLYVGGRSPTSTVYDRPNQIRGRLQVVSTASFSTTSTLELRAAVVELVATDKGQVAVTSISRGDGLTIINVTKQSEEPVSVHGGATLRLARDQKRLYLGDTGISPADYHSASLTKNGERYAVYDSPYHGELPLGGLFELSADGRFLIGSRGCVLRLGRTPVSDLRFHKKIDPFHCATTAIGCRTLVTASADGFLKAYDLEGFELKKALKVGYRVDRMVLDPKRRKLFVACADLARAPGQVDLQPRVGRIAAIKLGGP
jgi:S1-C subfamily serine protease/DNA-binding beta-propeller fold protein YncE